MSMPYVLRKFNCEACGAYVERKLSSKQPRECAIHGIERMVSSVRQMSRRDGTSWEKWKNSNGPKGRPRHDQE